jgi:hypothetical protein
LNPGFQSKPWADISQRFQRYSIFALFLQAIHRAKTAVLMKQTKLPYYLSVELDDN